MCKKPLTEALRRLLLLFFFSQRNKTVSFILSGKPGEP